ncbi:TIGR03086 family metal-binding protein [Amycolatopsis sp. H20-H5]|uniref:TIGR03086 family metal-binding protein n=1 Tax=Amycolatopsis sp. H20-H5 TaxID=3046309 RepID=UPI002DB7DE26|nr:TIGR03086 family metal-binding protein [Amycolatopsis sp. H20-H5]MEC3980292.1 TIGR03086 family metal-binding protein [Amycolatopsis sp. H20-H5]
MMSSTAEGLSRALGAVGHLVSGVRDDQWAAPTPCTEWTVWDLTNHLVVVNLTIAALIDGRTPPERTADLVGDDPAGAYRNSAAALRTVCEQPGALDRTIEGPLGTAKVAERLTLRIADLLVHAWDLAQATGLPLDLPEDLVEKALSFGQSPEFAAARADRFAAALAVADDAPAIDRLIALTGRMNRS